MRGSNSAVGDVSSLIIVLDDSARYVTDTDTIEPIPGVDQGTRRTKSEVTVRCISSCFDYKFSPSMLVSHQGQQTMYIQAVGQLQVVSAAESNAVDQLQRVWVSELHAVDQPSGQTRGLNAGNVVLSKS